MEMCSVTVEADTVLIARFATRLIERLRECSPEFLSTLEGLSDCPDSALLERLFLDFDIRAGQAVPASLANGCEVATLYVVPIIREGCPAALRALYRDLGFVHATAA